MSDKIYEPSNANMQQGARNVLKYLAEITYDSCKLTDSICVVRL